MASASNKICIITAGRPGHGKSTALNNIFGLDLPAETSAIGVTKELNAKNYIVKGGAEIEVIDTPGFGDLHIPQEDVVTDMKTHLEKRDYTLVYCINVGPGNRFTKKDVGTMELLQKALGKEVWSNCVILFTFSDYAREELGNTKEYAGYLEEFTISFQDVLTSLEVKDITVKSILACEGTQVCLPGKNKAYAYDRSEKENELIAIPVGGTKSVKEDILPNIIPKKKDWTYLTFIEILRVTKKEKIHSLLAMLYGKIVGSTMDSKNSDFFSQTFGDISLKIHTTIRTVEILSKIMEEKDKSV